MSIAGDLPPVLTKLFCLLFRKPSFIHNTKFAVDLASVPDSVDAELLAKVLSNPEMAALLASFAKTIK